MKILRQYESDFGMTYVQVMVNSTRTELAFDHAPKPEEIDALVKQMEAVTDPAPAETMTIKSAISFLTAEYAKVTTKPTAEQIELVKFVGGK